ncbi:MAG: GIY-YIG nuclease family protein [Lentimicrobiaceae bacterium]|nr:GIY-YIG nuclease family protein [Lentimicrobiaceae bacterium]MCB9016665.1 GIY-YIG nuclease family protein [Lentimicrobiaceae bacterium]MCB9016666.1 GIY-YIG nuclease family protein [Lentimicrobiaceae bacterium]
MVSLSGHKHTEYVVYILYSSRYNKFYIGYTSNLIERYKSHNFKGIKGWTTRFRPWKVVYVEVFADKQSALKREHDLKGAKARKDIIQKIHNIYPEVGFISA